MVYFYESEIKELRRKINNKEFRYLEDYDKEINRRLEAEEEIKKNEELISYLKKDNKELTKVNKKLMSENNNQKKEIEELNTMINDLRSDRYLIKKIPSGRTPNLNKAKVKTSVTTRPNVRKYIKEELDK